MIKISELNEHEKFVVQVEIKIRKIVGYIIHRELTMPEIRDLAELNILRNNLNQQGVVYEDIAARYPSGI
jgi:hypothetical protein